MTEASSEDRVRAPRIWAIGGGKGGVGKSVIATNVAATIAGPGTSVALVDADLGGANLHTLLGVPSPKANLSDFISKRVASLGEVMTPTPRSPAVHSSNSNSAPTVAIEENGSSTAGR